MCVDQLSCEKDLLVNITFHRILFFILYGVSWLELNIHSVGYCRFLIYCKD